MLVRRGVDGLLVGWLAVLVWIAVFVGHQLDLGDRLPSLTVVYWAGAVVTAAHFGVSYHLAYRGGTSALRQRSTALVTGPLVLAAILAGLVVLSLAGGTHVTRVTTQALITSVYLLTTWHYVKQVYGVGRIGAAYAGVKLGARDVTVLRYGLYPLWFLGAAQVLLRGRSNYLAGFRFGYDLLPVWAYDALRVLAIGSAVPLVVVLGGIAVRSRRVPSLLTAPYVAAFLWLGLPTDPLLLVLLLAAFHALQYLAVAHRAEVSLVAETPEVIGIGWWLNIFVGATCGGLLLSRWIPQYLDRHLAGPVPLLFTASFFVFLNLHHYLIDASIWRSKGELVRSMGRPQPVRAPAPAAAPVGAGV